MDLIRSFLILCFALISIQSVAQTANQNIKNFQAKSTQGKVFLTWTTVAGFSCQDIKILISADSNSSYRHIGTYFGICGDTSEQNYTYTIDSPYLNRTNYIKLELGLFGHSETIQVDIYHVLNSALVIPHPITKSTIIHFDNQFLESTVIEIYDVKGVNVNQIKTNKTFASIGSHIFYPGYYIYTIRRESDLTPLYRGKLIKN
ncbi:MAG: hypothetical protein ACPGYY_09935 [Bacteroidia bacterium]